MRNLLLLIVLSACCSLARAHTPCDATPLQEPDTVVVVGAGEYRRLAELHDIGDLRALRRERWHDRIDMHELRVGAGSINLSTIIMLSSGWFRGCCGDEPYRYGFRDHILDSRTYLTPERLVGTFSLSYTYHSKRRVQAGVMTTFAAVTQRRKDVFTDRTVEDLSHYSFSLMPVVRLLWLHRPAVSLYSSVSLGAVFTIDEEDMRVMPWYDVSLIGCTFGRRLFGFVEIGAGMSGMFRIGMGYRFNGSKKVGGRQ